MLYWLQFLLSPIVRTAPKEITRILRKKGTWLKSLQRHPSEETLLALTPGSCTSTMPVALGSNWPWITSVRPTLWTSLNWKQQVLPPLPLFLCYEYICSWIRWIYVQQAHAQDGNERLYHMVGNHSHCWRDSHFCICIGEQFGTRYFLLVDSLFYICASCRENHRFPSCAIPASEVRASVTCVVVLVDEVSALANWCV